MTGLPVGTNVVAIKCFGVTLKLGLPGGLDDGRTGQSNLGQML